MKKHNLLKALSLLCLPLGALCFSSTLVSCYEHQKKQTTKSIDGTDWDGRIRGSFAQGDYEIDEQQETITYTCGIGIQAIDLVIPDYVTFGDKKLKVYLGEQCFLNCSDLIGYVELNSFIDRIPDYCFAQCARLNGLLLNTKLIAIGKMAFFDCPLFEKIAILNYPYLDADWALSIISIGDYAFYKCMLSGDLIFTNKLQHLGAYCFDECFKINSVNLAICESIKAIPTAAFSGCSSISVVYLPPNLQEIGELAFKDCTNLQHVILPKDNMNIKLGKYCFEKCRKLLDFSKHFTIVGSLPTGAFAFNESLLSTPWSAEFGLNKIIEKNAFASCLISSVVFDPSAIADVGDYAFSSCSNLSVIDFSLYDPLTPPDWTGTHIFYDCNQSGTVYLPNGGLMSREWREFLLSIDLSDSWNIKEKQPWVRYICPPKHILEAHAGGVYTPGHGWEYWAFFDNEYFTFIQNDDTSFGGDTIKVEFNIIDPEYVDQFGLSANFLPKLNANSNDIEKKYEFDVNGISYKGGQEVPAGTELHFTLRYYYRDFLIPTDDPAPVFTIIFDEE